MTTYSPSPRTGFNRRLSLQLDRAIIAYEDAPEGSIAREVARLEKRFLEGGVPAFRRNLVRP